MLNLPTQITIAEVGPRDGLQGFPTWIDTETKVQMVDQLSELGLPVIEVSSFTHPKVVPNLRDAEEVFERIQRRPNVVYRGLVPNAKGARRAVDAKVGEMIGLITVSPTYTAKNQNMSMDEAVEQAILAFRTSDSHSIPFVMALGMSFWCAYEGTIPDSSVIDLIRRFRNAGMHRFYLAGSLGMEDPVHVNRLFSRIYDQFPDVELGFHVHNLSGMATANILAALDGGAKWLEGSICGIGGGMAMPTTIGSVGNFPTEDLIGMLSDMGIETGVDPIRVQTTARQIADSLGIEVRSHRAAGATRPEIMKMAERNPKFHP